MKINTREITTALVVLSPTPFAPPVVVYPQEHDTTEMIVPKTQHFIIDVMISQGAIARDAESKITLADTPYTASAKKTDAAMPMVKQRRFRIGPATIHASTLGVIK